MRFDRLNLRSGHISTLKVWFGWKCLLGLSTFLSLNMCTRLHMSFLWMSNKEEILNDAKKVRDESMKPNGDNFWNPCTVTKKELCNSSQDENRFISRALMGWCLLIKNMWQIVLAKKGLDMKCQTGLHPLALIKLSERYRDTETKGLIREIIKLFYFAKQISRKQSWFKI